MSLSTEQLAARSAALQKQSRIVKAEMNQLTASIFRLRDQMLVHERRMRESAARLASLLAACQERSTEFDRQRGRP